MYQYFTESGDSFQEAMEKIKNKYGSSAQVLNQRTISYGGFLGFFQKEGIEISGCIKHDAGAADRERAKLEEEKRKILALAEAKAQANQRAAAAEEKKEDRIQAVLDEVKSLQEKLDQLPSKLPQSDPGSRVPEHPTLGLLEAILDDNEFSPAYRRMILDRLRRESTMEALADTDAMLAKVRSWIAEGLQIFQEKRGQRPRIFILVGPTGVGKTTTIAKLAAVYGLGFGGQERLKLSLITIDNFRIGAKIQIETYADIMGIPVACPEDYDALRKRIELDSDKDMILIDTIGKSPKDFVKLAEMRQLLDGTGRPTEVHLAVSATTKTKDLREIFQQFEPFGYQSVVLTKLDETSVVGNLISLLWEKQKPVSFLTDGQAVPQDIHRATSEKLMKPLLGFAQGQLQLAGKE
jgi:flagellar biosynthesis protein FlhF